MLTKPFVVDVEPDLGGMRADRSDIRFLWKLLDHVGIPLHVHALDDHFPSLVCHPRHGW